MIPDTEQRLLRKLGHPSLRLGLGLPPGGLVGFDPRSMFTNGVQGLIYDTSYASKIFSDAGTTPAVEDGPIGRILDLSPNGNHANQTTSASKPVWKNINGKMGAQFDGSDDFLLTNSIDWQSDKVTAFVGFRKLSDATRAMLFEAAPGGNGNAFRSEAPNNTATANITFSSSGTVGVGVTKSSYAAPVTGVLTGVGNISGDVVQLYINGTLEASSGSDQGTGNYANYPIYWGRRGGSSLPFNGVIFRVVIIARLCTAAETASTLTWVNQGTGAF